MALPALSRAPAEERRAALLKWDSVNDDHRLAHAAVSTFEYQTFRINPASGHGTMGNALMMQKLTERQRQQNTWSMRHPESGPTGGHPSAGGQAPVTPPPFWLS